MKFRHKLRAFSAQQIALPQAPFLFSSRGKFYSLPRKMKLPVKSKAGKRKENSFPGIHYYIYKRLFYLTAIGYTHEVINLLQTGQTVLELLKILLLGKTPLHLA